MPQTKNKKPYNFIVCTFQGGGALGAYQAGILRALDEAKYYPDWYVGTSIGAINAAIAAGNPEKVRVEKIIQFWESIATPNAIDESMLPNDPMSRKLQHLLSAHASMLWGQPGFFVPRIPAPGFGWQGCPDTLSYYDTKPLRDTLEHYIDFDRINKDKSVRLSVGAVEVCSGTMVYFDSHKQVIGPEHIMASGALPPGFPAVEVDGKFYWDGGITNNSPIGYVFTHPEHKNMLCFMIDLFDSYGLYPTTLDEVLKRKKDIEYSSRFVHMIKLYQEVQVLKNNIKLLTKLIPEEQKHSQEMRLCCSRGQETTINLVRFLCKHDKTELASKDFEFSKKTIHERIATGYQDVKRAIKKSPWNKKVPITEGIVLHDMSVGTYIEENE